MVRIDVSLRGENVSEERVMVRTEYDDVKTFVINAASLDHILAEKVRTLLVRGMARDHIIPENLSWPKQGFVWYFNTNS